MTFKPYFDKSLNDEIRTQAEHDLVQRVMKMGYNEIKNLMTDLQADAAIYPGFERSRECKLQCKAIIRRVQHLKKAGMWHPPISIFEFIDAAMQGAIMGSEFAYRFLGVPRK